MFKVLPDSYKNKVSSALGKLWKIVVYLFWGTLASAVVRSEHDDEWFPIVEMALILFFTFELGGIRKELKAGKHW
jgi:phosphate starvation-inducible membrane PsiE